MDSCYFISGIRCHVTSCYVNCILYHLPSISASISISIYLSIIIEKRFAASKIGKSHVAFLFIHQPVFLSLLGHLAPINQTNVCKVQIQLTSLLTTVHAICYFSHPNKERSIHCCVAKRPCYYDAMNAYFMFP